MFKKNSLHFFFYKKEKKKKKNPFKKIVQSGGASQWRVFYQRGLPRLVLSPIIGFHI